MLTTRNYFAIALAAMISGVFTSSLLGGVLGAAAGLLMWHFRTLTSLNANDKWTATELVFNLVLALGNFAALILAYSHPALLWFTEPVFGGYMGIFIVNICSSVFGPRRS